MARVTAASGWRTGPVAVTGASGHVGRALQQQLTPALVDVMPADAVPSHDPAETATAFEIMPHTVGSVWPSHAP